MKRKALGKGLSSLIPSSIARVPTPTAPATALRPTELRLEVSKIRPNPRQPRRTFDEAALDELANSMKTQGLLQPVVVRPLPNGQFELIAGERRWRAAREAGVPTIPAVVRDVGDRDSLLLGLVENVARENLSPVEEARAYASLLDEFELSLGEIADRVGRSKPSVSNRVRLLELPEEVLWMLARGELSEGHARAVLSLPDDDARRRLARRIARDGMTVRAAEKAAQDGGARRRRTPSTVDPALAERARLAAQRLTGLPARVGAGKLELHFGDETRLEELVETLEAL
jgi:ParB family chromosome partitioning protein